MLIERKQISSTECMLFLSEHLPVLGTFFVNKTTQTSIELLQNIYTTQLADTILLTSDFLYIKSNSNDDLSDLEIISLAEIDDFSVKSNQLNAPISNTAEKIEIILKTIIAPFLQKDGGDIRLAQYQDGIVYVNFLGKCHGCPYATRTLKERVEKNLVRYLPEIKEVKLI